MSNGKVIIIHSIAGLIKKTQHSFIDYKYKKESIFSKTVGTIWWKFKVKVDLSNYATKTDIKNITHADASSLALKINLASLKTEVDKLHIDKLKSLPNN